MREIKFRFYNKTFKTMHYFTLGEAMEDTRHVEFANNIMQFTGLKDKNGTEIYEGDILEIDWNDKRYPKHIASHAVEWDEDRVCWLLGEGGSPKYDAENHMVVIGNIHENPSLTEMKGQSTKEGASE